MSVRVAWTRKRDEVGLPGWILLLPVRDAFQLLTSNHRTTPSQGALFFSRTADRLVPIGSFAAEARRLTAPLAERF